MEAVGRASPFTRTYLLEAHPVSFEKNVFTIGFDPEFEDHIGLVDNARNHTLLQTKLARTRPSERADQVHQGRGARAAAATPADRQHRRARSDQTPRAKAGARCRQSAAAPAAPAKEKLASVPFSKDDFKNDPLIQKALEIFKGQIVEVRA